MFDGVKCPNCGMSHFSVGVSMTTLMYYPPIYKNGVNVNPDGNTTTTEFICMECHKRFYTKTQYGEIIDCKVIDP